jgi:imidazolonepropionase-like amidohydrolase
MRTALFFALLAIACASSKPAPSGASAVRRSVLYNGQRVGSSTLTTAPDGTISNVFDIHSNGRGPHADATLRLAQDGTLAFLEARGHTEMGAPVEERFALQNGRAVWNSREEHGERQLGGPAFFIPLSSTDADAYLIVALGKHGGTLPLLPGGVARMEKAGEITVPIAGRDTRLVAQAITGLSFQPVYAWTREDGSFFAEVYPGFWFGEEGAESAAEAITAKQEELRRERDKRFAERLARKPPGGFALLHARVLDVERGVWLPDQTVVIGGDTIRAVGPAAQVHATAGAEAIDLGGKALLPGLWDMHAHLSPPDGALDIASGVTSARDVGNKSSLLDDFKTRFDEGTAVGPHVYRAGFIEGRGPDAAHPEVTAETEEEARAAVDFFAKRGYEMIKVYNSIEPELVPVITQEAHARGMGVTGHVPAHMLANEAVRAGYDGIEHINQLMLNFFADHQTDTRTLLRFSLVGERAAGFDLHSPQAEEFYALLREHRTVIDPTYVAFEQIYLFEQGKVPPEWAPTVARLPVQVQRQFLTGGLSLEGGKKELYARSWEQMLRVAKVLHDESVTVVAGTDSIAGIGLHRELELLVHGGLAPLEALRAATIVPARVMKVAEKTGSIAPGKIADLVVIDGDPLADISAVRRTVMTFRSGVGFPAKDVYESVGVAPLQASTSRSAASTSVKRNTKPESSNLRGTARWPSRSAPANSPRRIFKGAAGTGRSAGRCSARPSALAKSFMVTIPGDTRFTGPRSSW